MRGIHRLLSVSLILVVLGSFAAALPAAAVAYEDNPGIMPHNSHLIVGFNPGVEKKLQNMLISNYGGRIVERNDTLGFVVVETNSSLKFQQKLYRHPCVEYVEPDLAMFLLESAQYYPNDPKWDQQWGPQSVEADSAWDIEKGDNDILIAIVDTGVDSQHEDIENYIDIGYDFVNDDDDPQDDHGHGTHCAGIAAASMDNGKGIAGLAQVRVMAEKVLSRTGSGATSAVAAGIVHAVDSGADIISMSLGGTFGSQTLQNACDYAWNEGTLVVAAAGNDGRNIKIYPGSYDSVVRVGSIGQSETRSGFSNWGNDMELMAPGELILSTIPGNRYNSWSGTSMATPHVAGVAALVWSHNSSLTNQQLRDRLNNNATDLGAAEWDELYGYGKVNAYASLTGDDNPPPPPPDEEPPSPPPPPDEEPPLPPPDEPDINISPTSIRFRLPSGSAGAQKELKINNVGTQVLDYNISHSEGADGYSVHELVAQSPYSAPEVSGKVNWTFELDNPDQIGAPGEQVHYKMSVGNDPTSTGSLYITGVSIGFSPNLPTAYGDWYFDVDWPKLQGLEPGERFDDLSFGYFEWTDDVPDGYIQSGTMNLYASSPGSPSRIGEPYYCTIGKDDGDEGWLSVNPTSGEISPGTSAGITVSVDTAGLDDGNYHGELTITSNDPDEGVIKVPIDLNIGSPEGKPTMLIDKSHGQWFDVRGLTRTLVDMGWTVDKNNKPFTSLEDLEDYGVILIPFSYKHFTSAEVAILKDYVARGGGIWMISNAGFGANTANVVSRQFGIEFNDDIIRDTTNNKSGRELWPEMYDLQAHDITDGVNSFYCYSACSLNVEDANNIIASGDNDAWSATYPKGENPPVLAAVEHGVGRIVFSGDLTPLHPDYYPDKLNAQEELLLLNTVNWLAGIK
ncbi:MAG: S8 family serine peptidase [Chloroflexota bacterium]|nr:S8 family serine peptidase [Chloroflexota bacterium]